MIGKLISKYSAKDFHRGDRVMVIPIREIGTVTGVAEKFGCLLVKRDKLSRNQSWHYEFLRKLDKDEIA